MTARTYRTLEAEAAEWLSREGDPFFLAMFPLFVQLAETRMRKRLRTRKMQGKTTLTLSAGLAAAALPADFAGIRGGAYVESADGEGAPQPLAYIASPIPQQTLLSGALSRPLRYFIYGGKLVVYPVANADYVVTLPYYQRLVSIGPDRPSNIVIEKHPDVYFGGVMFYAQMWLQNFEKAAEWKGKFMNALIELTRSDKADQFRAAGGLKLSPIVPADTPMARRGRVH